MQEPPEMRGMWHNVIIPGIRDKFAKHIRKNLSQAGNTTFEKTNMHFFEKQLDEALLEISGEVLNDQKATPALEEHF